MSGQRGAADMYEQGGRSVEEVRGLAELRAWLDHCYGPRQHLTLAQQAAPRHQIKPFGVTLHLETCKECATANQRLGGRWLYPPLPVGLGGS